MATPASTSTLAQAQLFGARADCAIPGLKYQPDFLSSSEELTLLEIFSTLALKEAEYRQWHANRRTVSYGGKYDFTANELLPAEPVAQFLLPLRARIAAWAEIAASQFNHAIIAEYRTGTQLGWHRDVHHFESVAGVSLAGPARMRFRPYPTPLGNRRGAFALDLQPRSVYSMQGCARWDWQHAISATKTLRYSITFRTLAEKLAPRTG
jgi:alkylated DNA repair dioxygenase AlkB